MSMNPGMPPSNPRPVELDQPWDVTPKIFPVKMSGAKQWQEQTLVGGVLVDYTDGRNCTSDSDPSAAITIDGSTPASGDFGTMIEIMDADDYYFLFVPLGGSVRPVLVKSNGGSDGSPPSTPATWSYDIYALSDTGFTTKLNLSGPLVPYASRAEVVNASVTKAGDGTVGFAYTDASGAIQLFLVKDFLVQNSCDDGSDSPAFGF